MDQLSKSDKYFNREISWLEFNDRVLAQAADTSIPLFERIRFLSIFTSNLDEFVMKRVGGLKRQVDSGLAVRSKDGLTPTQQLEKVREHILKSTKTQRDIFHKQVLPNLEEHKIYLVRWQDLKAREINHLREYFKEHIFPILTPLSVDQGHPFPFISNLSTSLGVSLKRTLNDTERLFARIKIPEFVWAWIAIPPELNGKGHFRFISVIQIIKNNLQDLFPGMHVIDSMPFRVTRNATIDEDDTDTEDLIEHVREGLKERKFAEAIRLEYIPQEDDWILKFLIESLELASEDVYDVVSPLDFTSLSSVLKLDIPEFKFKSWKPTKPFLTPNLKGLPDREEVQGQEEDLFGLILRKDQFVHHPYQSFRSSIERFIRTASEDPKVRAIKMTLYRTGDESPIVDALIRAAENGIQVVCLIELKARFDEKRNIEWAEKMEGHGIHVVYGVVGLKTHSKTTLVVREKAEGGYQTFAHIGTGNYHAQTANLYTDMGIFTANDLITNDLMAVFNFLTGRSTDLQLKSLLVAPINMKDYFLSLIEREISHVKAKREGFILAKMNSLEDKEVTKALYQASQKGVKIELHVRGFCCLKPGVKGMSENIRVFSYIGRFLEHSRVFYFNNGAPKNPKVPGTPSWWEGDCFIGSADWMYRNLHNRVEVITPVLSSEIKREIGAILQAYREDSYNGWELQSDGSYSRCGNPKKARPQDGVHSKLMKAYSS